MPKVSVIVPVYNVAGFIRRCTESLFAQTLEDVEFIFVDDASPDDSVETVERVAAGYPHLRGRIRILHHEANRGLPAARNTGLSAATGDYVFHCDSDDYVEPDMLEKMWQKAADEDADIVYTDWYLTYSESERYMRQPAAVSPDDAVRKMLSGAMKFNVWNKLVRRSLYADHGVSFPDGYGMGEDMTMIRLFCFAKKVAYLPEAFYHYVKTNTAAFSQTYSQRHLAELKHNVAATEEFLRSHFGDKYESETAFLKLDVKFPFLVSDDAAKYALWREWFPEANRYIGRNRQISLRATLLQKWAARGWFGLIKMYYTVVYKTIYRALYR